MHTNDAQLLVLTVLADSPDHGYGINTRIERLVGSRLGPGSLYGALARLEARQLIEPLDTEPPGAKDGQRTVRITDAGRTALRVELDRMTTIADAGLRALGTAPA